MKLFPKLTIFLSLSLLGTVLLTTGLLYWSEQRWIKNDERSKQEVLLQNLAHIASESILTNDDLLIVKFVRMLQKQTPELLMASVTNDRGQILAHSEPQKIGQITDPNAPNTPSAALHLSQPVTVGNRVYGQAVITFSQEHLDSKLSARVTELRDRLLSIALVTLFGAVLLSFYISHSWTKPIRRIVENTKEIGKGKWDTSLHPYTERRDELGVMSCAIEHMADQLSQLDQMKEDFVSAVTHELRSPLGAIESHLNVLNYEQGTNQPPEIRNTLERIRVNTERLSKFVNDLLDVAALERGKVRLDLQPVDMKMMIVDVATMFDARLKERHLSATINCPPSLPKAWVDPDKIFQVLVNLLSNSIKFSPDESQIQIIAEYPKGSKTLSISVVDQGMGIAPHDQVRIFNKFEQVKGVRKTIKGPKGTGLGLPICREIVELHNGTIQVVSDLASGSRFTFTLPVYTHSMPDLASMEPSK